MSGTRICPRCGFATMRPGPQAWECGRRIECGYSEHDMVDRRPSTTAQAVSGDRTSALRASAPEGIAAKPLRISTAMFNAVCKAWPNGRKPKDDAEARQIRRWIDDELAYRRVVGAFCEEVANPPAPPQASSEGPSRGAPAPLSPEGIVCTDEARGDGLAINAPLAPRLPEGISDREAILDIIDGCKKDGWDDERLADAILAALRPRPASKVLPPTATDSSVTEA